ncbi:MAG: hypothetical protein ACR2MD_15180 [Aridibacter sp.]
MSKIKLALIVAVVFAFQVGGIFAQNLGKPGEQTGKGTVILKAARIIDGTGKAPIKNGLVVIEDNKSPPSEQAIMSELRQTQRS